MRFTVWGETIAMTNESLVQTADTNDAVDIFNAPMPRPIRKSRRFLTPSFPDSRMVWR